jgi:hypothetical protein
VTTTIQIDQLTKDDQLEDTVAQLKPLFTWRGQAVYPVFGAEGEGEGEGGPDGEPDDDADDDAGEEDDSGDSSSTVTQAEYDRLKRQLQAADKGKAEMEKRLRAIEDGKKDELTKATERVQELEKAQEVSTKEIADLRLQNAFLTADTGITWHDPGDALALAERKGYLDEVVDEDGKVDSGKLTAKLKELAKAKPHLVKTGKDDADKGGKDSGSGKATGSKVGSKGTGGKDTGPDLSRYERHLNR